MKKELPAAPYFNLVIGYYLYFLLAGEIQNISGNVIGYQTRATQNDASVCFVNVSDPGCIIAVALVVFN